MARVISIGAQDFESIILKNCFYVDKTDFIKEWWDSQDVVTLITRPRRFGKTLNMSMLDRFFNIRYGEQGELFKGLNIWKEERYRRIQGTWPVISLSFAGVKEKDYEGTVYSICKILRRLYAQCNYLMESDQFTDGEKAEFRKMADEMPERDAPAALNVLCEYMCRYYGKKVIILLDEYDTPLQEAYVKGYWKELVSFTRNLFNSAFKTNPYLERAIMTGITRVSRESMFSDLNNLNVITTTSDEYAAAFGFTEEEVFAAMDEMGLADKEGVKSWYDGFTIGEYRDIYNPWSVVNYLDKGKLKPYWANTSSNSLVGNLLQKSDQGIKMQFEQLLSGQPIHSVIDEEIVYDQLDDNPEAIWSLLLASGYLKVNSIVDDEYELCLTNYEVKKMFNRMVKEWFAKDSTNYNGFIHALLKGDLEEMNAYMERVCLSMFSFFDSGTHLSEESRPERFYHGFVLGLLVDLTGRYAVTSNRESGFGRYDVMLEPLNKEEDGIILEFKVHNPKKEECMEDTVKAALQQIEEKHYEQILLDHGISRNRIRKYGFAFKGKAVLIGGQGDIISFN